MLDIFQDFAFIRTEVESFCVRTVDTTNEALSGFTPTEIIILTIVTLLSSLYVIDTLRAWWKIGPYVLVFRFFATTFFKAKTQAEGDKAYKTYYEKYLESRKNFKVTEIPEKPMTEEQIMTRLKAAEVINRKCYKDGAHMSGGVYIADDAHWEFVAKAQGMFVVTNPLHMEEFAPISQMEAEIIRMVANLYNGDKESCGLVTSGGTESIILAILAYREIAAERGVKTPNMVMSNTAHAAFDKAAFYFGIELRKVQQTPDLTVDMRELRRQIDSNTICLVASAPEFSYGNFDPVLEISALAQKWKIGCHVDCCLGSFVNAFAERSGFKLPHLIDFRVPGVTSISCDPHKYGFGPKGLSVLLFRNQKIRSYQFFATMKWNGGFYTTTTIAGSRPGSVIAGTWAAMMKIGATGYTQNTKIILSASENARKAIRNEIPEVQVASRHSSSVLALVNRTDVASPINVIALADVMKDNFKWGLSKIQNPSGLHISFTLSSAKDWRRLVDDLKKSIKLMRENPDLNHSESTATYGMVAKIPDSKYLNNLAVIHNAAYLDAI